MIFWRLETSIEKLVQFEFYISDNSAVPCENSVNQCFDGAI